jgi:lipopolysaccharide/colanic/teichoic acid biosynthesis glycosyltransferase
VDVSPAVGWYAAVKPAVDLFLAVVLLVPSLPVIAGCWLLVKLTSRGPGFYTQVRAGLGGRPYTIIKLRTMRFNAEAKGGAQWAKKGDVRITAVGRFLRKTHLDELPQLFNVLQGQMSLVGPRPERPELINGKGLASQIPGYTHRLTVKPGVTGLAQIQLPADTDLTSARHKTVYDLYYIAHQTAWLDLRIVVATAFKAAGIGPGWLRRLFALPTRDQVADGFRRTVVTPVPVEPTPGRLQPEPA